jgi:DNA modification methylase
MEQTGYIIRNKFNPHQYLAYFEGQYRGYGWANRASAKLFRTREAAEKIAKQNGGEVEART